MANEYMKRNQAIMGGLPLTGDVTFDEFEDARLNGLLKDINNTNNFTTENNLLEPPVPQVDKKMERRKALQDIADRFGIIGAQQSGNYQAAINMQNRLEQRKQQEEQQKTLKKAFANNPELEKIYNLFGAQAAYNYAYGQPKNNQPASVKEYQFAKQNGYQGSYEDFLQSKKQSTNINLNQGNLGKLGQELAADDYKKKRELAADANAVLTNVDTLENLLNQGVNTGFGANLSLGLQRIGQSIIGEDYKMPEIAGREAFQAASTQLILPLVKQLGVNPTDKDLDFVRTGSAELGKSESGNKLMLTALRLSANRRIDEQIFNQNFYAQPENQNATIYQRDIAFEEHKRNNPELYTSITLQQAYDDLLLNQATSSSIITSDEKAPFIPEWNTK